jgi:hypothetical protein
MLTLPTSMGGVGICNAELTAPFAYFSSFAASLPSMKKKFAGKLEIMHNTEMMIELSNVMESIRPLISQNTELIPTLITDPFSFDQNLQHKLMKEHYCKSWEEMISCQTVDNQAHMRCRNNEYSSAVLRCCPLVKEFSLSEHDCRFEVAYATLNTLPNLPHFCSCGNILTIEHMVSCGPCSLIRHNLIQAVFVAHARCGNIPTQQNPRYIIDRNNGKQAEKNDKLFNEMELEEQKYADESLEKIENNNNSNLQELKDNHIDSLEITTNSHNSSEIHNVISLHKEGKKKNKPRGHDVPDCTFFTHPPLETDFTVICPPCQSYVAQAAKKSGHGIEVAEKRKNKLYKVNAESRGHHFLPSAIETHGLVGPGMNKVITRLVTDFDGIYQCSRAEFILGVQFALVRGNALCAKIVASRAWHAAERAKATAMLGPTGQSMLRALDGISSKVSSLSPSYGVASVSSASIPHNSINTNSSVSSLSSSHSSMPQSVVGSASNLNSFSVPSSSPSLVCCASSSLCSSSVSSSVLRECGSGGNRG